MSAGSWFLYCLFKFALCIILQEVSDLQEQLADLMRHLDTQQAIANKPDEMRQVSRHFSFSIITVQTLVMDTSFHWVVG